MTATEERITFCRICEACCGMVATVEDGRVTKLRADRDNPFSDGYVCARGPAYLEIHNDPDRVLHPLKRQPDGTFTPVSWDDALDDIAGRLRALFDTDGRESVGWYVGQPDRLQLRGVLLDHGIHGRHQVAARVHGRVGRHQQPLGGQRWAVRQPADQPHPRPRGERLPLPRRHEPVRLPRQHVDRPPHPGEAAGAPEAGRAGHRRRPPPHRDRRGVRAPARPARWRRLAAGVEAARDLRLSLVHHRAHAPPYAVWTDAVEEPRGEARPEWWVVAQIGRRLGVEPSAVPAVRALGKLGVRASSDPADLDVSGNAVFNAVPVRLEPLL